MGADDRAAGRAQSVVPFHRRGFLCGDAFHTRVQPMPNCPILILHGRRDGTIPVSHGRTLHALSPGSRYVEQDCGHNDWVTDWGEIIGFLRESGLLPPR